MLSASSAPVLGTHPALARPAPPCAQVMEENQRVHVSFTGEFGYNRVSPRDLHSQVRRAASAEPFSVHQAPSVPP